MRAEVGRGCCRQGLSASEDAEKRLDRPSRMIVRKWGWLRTLGEDGVGPGGDSEHRWPVLTSVVWMDSKAMGSHGSLLSRKGRIPREVDGGR